MNSFFFNDTATTEIYTLSLHDALPISADPPVIIHRNIQVDLVARRAEPGHLVLLLDRKSTRLNSSHVRISYAVFCLKKKTLNGYPPRGGPALDRWSHNSRPRVAGVPAY